MRYVGKLDKSIYRCITGDIISDEVIITDERMEHIKVRHPGHLEKVMPFLAVAVEAPDYILEDVNPHTGLVLKQVEENGLRFQVILRIQTPADHSGFQNSVISAWVISERRWNNYVRSRKILYKRE